MSKNATSKGRISRQGAEAGGLISGPALATSRGHDKEEEGAFWFEERGSPPRVCFISFRGAHAGAHTPHPTTLGPGGSGLPSLTGQAQPPGALRALPGSSWSRVHCPRPLWASLPPCPAPKVLLCCRMLPGCVRGCGQSQERGHPLARAHVALCWRVAAALEGSPGRGLHLSA